MKDLTQCCKPIHEINNVYEDMKIHRPIFKKIQVGETVIGYLKNPTV